MKTIKLSQIIIALLQALALLITGPLVSVLTTGYVNYGFLCDVPQSHYDNAAVQPSNPNATPEARALLAKLQSVYGEYTLSGQYIDTFENYALPQFLDANGKPTVLQSNELTALASVTDGKLPAVLGLDYFGVECAGEWDDYMTQFAIEWHKLGGIVTFCWHWQVAKDINGSWGRYDSDMRTDSTNFRLTDAFADERSIQYQKLLEGIDRVSEQLAILQDAGVPVLWRPYHEAAGGWFWWGATGKEDYQKLYRMTYDIMTNEKGLNNLIWVFNAQNKAWYVGDEYCDMVADDPYPINNMRELYALDPGRVNRFKYHQQFAGNKMIAMSENDVLPSIDKMYEKGTKWLFFCTWMREMVVQYDPDDQPWGMTNEYSELYNSKETLRAVYEHPNVLTLDEIQSWGLAG